MKLLTKETASKVRCFPIGEDGKVFARMLTATETAKIRSEARAEAKGSEEVFESLFRIKYMKKAVTNWEGFVDIDGNEIPYAEGIIADLFDVNPQVMSLIFGHVSNEILHIKSAEEKNSEAGATA